jgi:hypothetical protein
MKLRIGTIAFLAALLTAVTVPAALANYVYWPNIGGSTIGRMAPDGSQLNNDFITTQKIAANDEVKAVALDSRYVYWAHGNGTSGAIGRAKLDGSDVQSNFIPPSAGVIDPFGVAVTATHLYWVSSNGGTIGRADIDGANPDPNFIPLSNSPCGLAADDNFLYFTFYLGGGGAAVARVRIGGGTPDEDFIPVPESKDCGVAVDGSHVYWVEYPPSGPYSGIGRANLDGSEVNHTFIPPAGIWASGVAVTPQYIFWGTAFTDHSVGRAGIDGAAPDDLFAPAGPPDAAAPYLLAASPSNSFTVGKAKLNKRKGVATISATVPGPGVLVADASSKGIQAVASRKKRKKGPTVKRAQATAGAPGIVELKIRARGRAARALRTKGKAKLKVGITFTPQGIAGIPSVQTTKVTLKRRGAR